MHDYILTTTDLDTMGEEQMLAMAEQLNQIEPGGGLYQVAHTHSDSVVLTGGDMAEVSHNGSDLFFSGLVDFFHDAAQALLSLL